MSIRCYECKRKLHPTRELPGSHAGNIRPIVQTQVFLRRDNQLVQTSHLNKLQFDLDVCLQCIEDGIKNTGDDAAFGRLAKVYKYSQAGYENRARNFRRTYNMELDQDSGLHWKFDEAYENIAKCCLVCGVDQSERPHLQFEEFDRFGCRLFEAMSFGAKVTPEEMEEDDSPSIYHGGIEHNPLSGLVFSICFDCMMTILPKTLDGINWLTNGLKNQYGFKPEEVVMKAIAENHLD